LNRAGGDPDRPAPTSVHDTSRRSIWFEAARPRTLSASIVPVIVGTASSGRWSADRFIGALVVSLALQIGVNYANDYFDWKKGVDREERVGPRRAVASGLVSPAHMRVAMLIAFAVAVVAGTWLAAVVGFELLIVGAASLAAALAYSGGSRPYGAAGLGEVFVFVFFGLVATTGSAYVQIERITAVAVLASVPVGLLAAAILVANNVRDLDSDRSAGKNTLAVRLGPQVARTLHRLLLLGGFTILPLVAGARATAWPLIAFLALPFAVPPFRAIESHEAPILVRALAGTARLQLVFGTLLAVGLWLD
jgi:1,4-dihydroxy-2-naphthoate polyprenyltransferase